MRRTAGFTLIELLVAVAVVAVLLTLAGPAMYDYMLVQRLKSINSQLVTDLNFARSEAVTRNTFLRVVFDSDSNVTCYTLFTNPAGAPNTQRCDCKLGPGAACSASDSSEVRTVVVQRSTGVLVQAPGNVTTGTGSPAVGFNNTTGGLLGIPTDKGVLPIDHFTMETSLSSTRLLRTVLSGAGRATVCSVGSNLGAVSC